MTLAWRWKYRLVNTPGEIAEALPAAWPIDDGEDYIVAVRACLTSTEMRPPAMRAQPSSRRATEWGSMMLKLPKMLGSPTFGTITFKLR
jgi:hypothetical protein